MKENKIVFTIIFAFIIFLIVMYNNQKSKALTKNRKYTIVKILDAQVHGKNNTKYTFELNGSLMNSYSKLLWRNERDSVIGKNIILEYDSTNYKNSKILLGYKISDTVKIPINGWNEIPEYLIKVD